MSYIKQLVFGLIILIAIGSGAIANAEGSNDPGPRATVEQAFKTDFPIPIVGDWEERDLQREVWSVLPLNGNLYVAGKFKTVERPNGTRVTRDSIYAFDASGTGLGTLLAFAPKVTKNGGEGIINKVIASYDNKHIVIAGDFDSVNGVSVQNAAQIRLSDGKASRMGAFDRPVTDVERAGNHYIFFGRFTKANGVSQAAIASITPTGAYSNYFRLNVRGSINGYTTFSYRGAVNPNGKEMAATINATSVGGLARKQVVKFDLQSSGVTVQNWNSEKAKSGGCNDVRPHISDIFYDGPDRLYTTGYLGGCWTGFGDQTILWDANKRGTTNIVPVWSNRTCTDSIHSGTVYRGYLYAAGHMKCTEATPGGAFETDMQVRNGIFALSPTTGRISAWRHDQPRCVGGKELLGAYGRLWAGTDCGDGLYARAARN